MPDYYEFSVPEASKKLIGIYELETNLAKQFWEEFRDRFVWELIPGQFLYDLYKAWAEQDMGVRNVEGKNTFLNVLRRIVDDDSEWEYLSTSVPLPDSFNQKSEYLLGEYGLFKWMNGRYHGADLLVFKDIMLESVDENFGTIPKSLEKLLIIKKCVIHFWKI